MAIKPCWLFLQDHLINAQFVDNSLVGKPDYLAVSSEAVNSSYIGAISLWHKDSQVEVTCNEMGKMSGTQHTAKAMRRTPNVALRLQFLQKPKIIRSLLQVHTNAVH